jgi:hypothetical protein
VCVCVSSLPLHAIQCNVNDEMERTIGLQQKSVEFQFKTGVQAKDYSSVAKKGNLKPIEVEVKRLEDTVSCNTLFPPPPPSAPHLLFPPPPNNHSSYPIQSVLLNRYYPFVMKCYT